MMENEHKYPLVLLKWGGGGGVKLLSEDKSLAIYRSTIASCRNEM